MIKWLIQSVAVLSAAFPCYLFGINWHTIQAIDPNFQTVTLEDGSVWTITEENQPNVKTPTKTTYPSKPWEIGNDVLILPIFQAEISHFSLQAIMVNWDPHYNATLVGIQKGSTQLFISAIDVDAGTITLSNGDQYSLDSRFKKHYSLWSVNDPITLGGEHHMNSLINGSSDLAKQTFVFVKKATPRKPRPKSK